MIPSWLVYGSGGIASLAIVYLIVAYIKGALQRSYSRGQADARKEIGNMMYPLQTRIRYYESKMKMRAPYVGQSMYVIDFDSRDGNVTLANIVSTGNPRTESQNEVGYKRFGDIYPLTGEVVSFTMIVPDSVQEC